MRVYRNYFLDTSQFTDLLRDIINEVEIDEREEDAALNELTMHRQQLMDEIYALIHPPRPSAPDIIVLEQGTGRLGYSDFDPP